MKQIIVKNMTLSDLILNLFFLVFCPPLYLLLLLFVNNFLLIFLLMYLFKKAYRGSSTGEERKV